MIGVPAYGYGHTDEYVLSVLSTILGGGMSSRLFTEVREKRGLAYSVHSWVEKYPDTGYVAVQAGVEHGKLDVSWQRLVSHQSWGVSSHCSVSQVVVLAWQIHLHPLVEGQS